MAVLTLSCMVALLLAMNVHAFAPFDWQNPKTCPSADEQDKLELLATQSSAPQSLIDHTKEFKQEIIEVTDGVWFAIGFDLGNSIMIKAPEGVIIIDTMDSEKSATPVADQFKKLSNGAIVKGVIYTHNHPDHTSGTKAFLKNQEEAPQIWGYKGLIDENWDKFQYSRPVLISRSFRMFGVELPEGALINCGLGPVLHASETAGLLPLPPNKFLTSDQQDINVGGLDMTLIYIPGETRDQMATYIPSIKALSVGDDFYKAFPNLYSIRGTPPRPVRDWAKSIDLMLKLVIEKGVEYLLPSHTRPVVGNAEIVRRLTKYRDGIMYVHDQTIRLANHGLHPQEIVKQVELPASLRNEPDLLQHYGNVEWSVKTVFEGQLGWFSGFPEELLPVTPSERGAYMIEMVGEQKLLSECERALAAGDFRWSLELASHVFNALPGHKEAMKLRAESMVNLASEQTSPNGRNYLLKWMFEENCIMDQLEHLDLSTILNLPFERTFSKLATMLLPQKVEGLSYVAYLMISDRHVTMTIRNSILQNNEEKPASETPDLRIETDEQSWRELIARVKTPQELVDSGELTVSSIKEMQKFIGFFESV